MRYLKALIRGSMHTIVYTVVGIVVLLYLVIRLNIAGYLVRTGIESELSDFLGTRITLEGGAEVDWLNQVVLNHLTVYDQQDDTLIYARRVMVGYEVLPMLLEQRLVLNTTQLVDFEIRTHRPSKNAEPNYRFLMDVLSGSGDDNKKTIKAVDLGAVLLRRGIMTYDVDDEPHDNTRPFDLNHIHLSQLSANVTLHNNLLGIKNLHGNTDKLQLRLRRGSTHLTRHTAKVQDLQIDGMVTAQIEAEASADTSIVKLHQLSYPALYQLEAEATLHLSAINTRRTDSTAFRLELTEASCNLPDVGHTKLSGTIQGCLASADLQMTLATPQGQASAMGNACWLRDAQQARFEGQLSSYKGIDLSTITPKKFQLGTIAFDTDIDLRYDIATRTPQIAAQATLPHLEISRHTYHDVQLEAFYSPQRIDGTLQVADSLADADLKVHIDRSHRQPRYQLTGDIRRLYPNAIGLTQWSNSDSLGMGGKIHADIIGKDWTQMEGIVEATGLYLNRQDDTLRLEPLLLEGTPTRGHMTSHILYADYAKRRRHSSEYDVHGRIPAANRLMAMLRLPYHMTGGIDMKAVIDTAGHLLSGTCDVPRMAINDGTYVTARLTSTSEADTLLPHLALRYETEKHALSTMLTGRISLKPELDVLVNPATLLYNKEEITLTGAHLHRDATGDLQISDCALDAGTQHLAASGIIAKNGQHDMKLQLRHFDLGRIFNMLPKRYTHFGGLATGIISIGGTPHTNIRTDSLFIEEFSYIDTLLGKAYLTLDMQTEPTKRIQLSADIDTPADRWPKIQRPADQPWHTHIDGDIRLNRHDTIDLVFKPDHLPIGFIDNWVGNVLHEFYGWACGELRLFGDTHNLNIMGHPLVDGQFTHPTLGAYFHLQDTLHMDYNHMHFDDVTVDDLRGHSLLANVSLLHDDLHNFRYDADIRLPENGTQGFLAFDRPKRRPGDTWWGQLYAQGRCRLHGGGGEPHHFSINFRPASGSWFYLSPHEQNFNNDAVYSMLTFRDKATLSDANTDAMPLAEDINAKQTQASHSTPIEVDMQIEATEHCQVTVQMDPMSTTDLLRCRGNGTLALHYDTRRDITLAGIYNIQSGTYSMSMRGDLMNKVFQLEKTSHVSFSGMPSEAELSLDATYTIPSVNLADLDQNITTIGSMGRSTVPVDCQMKVTGLLNAPQVDFDLDIRNVNAEVQAYVHNIIATPELRNQEVLYLLLFSKFYTPQYAQAATQNRGSSELSSFASAGITSQLNQLMGRLSNNFTMGTNVRSDRGDFSDMEMDVSLSTHLLGDRLQLSGNFGYRDPAHRIGTRASNTSNFIGDFDMEFLVNTRGTIRLKAYSHYNERDFNINNALSTQGIGIMWRKDFKNFRQLFGIH